MATRKKATKTKSRTKAAAKKSARKVVKLKAKAPAKKSAAKAASANGLPKPSTKPWGQAGKALDGVKVLDFTHVQSGPTCTQLLGYMGADCIKVERPGAGDHDYWGFHAGLFDLKGKPKPALAALRRAAAHVHA